ncbi:MAG: FAD:protein FMN transferase [Candidatus Woesearchaeota archaeon]
MNKKFKLFGSETEFSLETEDVVAEPLMNEAYVLALRLQKIFNVHDSESEISVLNRLRNINASDELLELTKIALKLSESSYGEYDITLGKHFLERKSGKQLSEQTCSYKNITIEGNNITLTNDSVLLDFGSIAKGYIAERIAKFFQDEGAESGYVDARGDLRVFGDQINIGVQHPRNTGLLHTIKVKAKGIATSGDYKQYDKDYSKSHIINQKDIISATVIADDLTEADAYATILMVCNEKIREKLIKNAGFPAMTVDKNLNTKYYNNYEALLNEN